MTSADFKSLFSNSSEAELRRSSIRLNAMTRGMWVPGGADGRRLSVPTLARLNTGLALPEGVRLESRPSPIDYMGTFISLKDYLDPSEMPGGSPEAVAEQIIASQDPRVLLLYLAYLNHLCNVTGEINRFIVGYKDTLRPDLRASFDKALEEESKEGEDALLFARQPVLAAIRAVLEAYPWAQGGLEEPSLVTAILLVHAVGSSISELKEGDARSIGNIPADLMMEMVRIGMLYEQDDDYSIIDRTLRYWREHVLNLKRTKLRTDPRQLLEEALGMPFEDFFALGLWVWLQARTRDPRDMSKPLTLPASLPGVMLPRERVERFLGIFR